MTHNMPVEMYFKVMSFVRTINSFIDGNVVYDHEDNVVSPHNYIASIKSLLNSYPGDHPMWNGPVKLLTARLHVLETIT